MEENKPEKEDKKKVKLGVKIEQAEGQKCERCWKYRTLGNHEGYETICDDCYDAIMKKLED